MLFYISEKIDPVAVHARGTPDKAVRVGGQKNAALLDRKHRYARFFQHPCHPHVGGDGVRAVYPANRAGGIPLARRKRAVAKPVQRVLDRRRECARMEERILSECEKIKRAVLGISPAVPSFDGKHRIAEGGEERGVFVIIIRRAKEPARKMRHKRIGMMADRRGERIALGA